MTALWALLRRRRTPESLGPVLVDGVLSTEFVVENEAVANKFAGTLAAEVEADAVTVAIPMEAEVSVADIDAATLRMSASRRIKRLTETREIQVRTTHRRRKVFARGGVLASFGLAMVVYPVMGNVVEYHGNAAEGVPGVVLGESPTTAHALLGDGPVLIPTELDLPAIDPSSKVATVAADRG